MDKLSSPSFFKLTQSDVCKIKENSARDIVKKWFQYLKLKPNQNAKVAQVQEVPPEVETDAILEECYDMDELMEHRILNEDEHFDGHFELKFSHECDSGVAKYHVENMSTLQSRYLLKEYEKAIRQLAINDADPLQVVYKKQREEAKVRENATAENKRLAILSEIFYCLNEKVVKIPDVTKELESLRNFSITDPKNVIDRALPSVAQRYAAYLVVAKRAKQLIHEVVRKIEGEMIERVKIVAQLNRQHDAQILKEADVVGKRNPI